MKSQFSRCPYNKDNSLSWGVLASLKHFLLHQTRILGVAEAASEFSIKKQDLFQLVEVE